jgi:exopolyphosphatase / guanosine-5'-triphosphate,3'-diphosphate pyrophosphatase
MKERTRLSESFDGDGAITPAGIRHVVAAVRRVLRAGRRLPVDRLYAFVTSAVRDATNRDHVLDRLERGAGLRPQFLSGDEEAKLVYLAARRWYGWSAGRLLVLDIGGGSMEFALGGDAEPELTASMPLGAGRLTRAFLPDDLPDQCALDAVRDHVLATVRDIAGQVRRARPQRVVATSKTFAQLARLTGAPPRRAGPFALRTLAATDLVEWIPRLATLRVAKRVELPGVSRPRARQILAGAIVASSVMDALDVSRLEICPWALREGVLLRHMETCQDHPLRPLAGAC